MEPQTPVLPGYNLPETNYAENQPEYRPLPAVRTHDGLVLSRWELTKEERAALAGEASLFLFVWLTTCSRCGEQQPLTPLLPEITTPKAIMERAAAQQKSGEASQSAPGNGHAEVAPETLLSQAETATAETPPSDEEIGVLFRQLWESQIGRPGYRERRWKDFRALLKRRGITV